jgi:hypothetical protein
MLHLIHENFLRYFCKNLETAQKLNKISLQKKTISLHCKHRQKKNYPKLIPSPPRKKKKKEKDIFFRIAESQKSTLFDSYKVLDGG